MTQQSRKLDRGQVPGDDSKEPSMSGAVAPAGEPPDEPPGRTAEHQPEPDAQ